MTHTDEDCELDLDAVCAAQWADPEIFPAAEFARAEMFYRQRRQHDEVLLAVRTKATSLVRAWTGRQAQDVGSFGLRLNAGMGALARLRVWSLPSPWTAWTSI